MKIWVDDIRTPPDDSWYWYKTSRSVIDLFQQIYDNWGSGTDVEILSLDHDLGGDDTTRKIVLFMCSTDFWPVEVRVHSANPVGREWLEGMIERYK